MGAKRVGGRREREMRIEEEKESDGRIRRDSKCNLGAVGQRITFQEEFAAETSKTGVDRWYARVGVRNRSFLVGQIKERAEGGRGAEGARSTRDGDEALAGHCEQSESERSRKHRLYSVIAPWRVRGGA